jgi:predicted transcriptional regulator
VVRLSNELGTEPSEIAEHLDEAQEAGLIAITDDGRIIPILPTEIER